MLYPLSYGGKLLPANVLRSSDSISLFLPYTGSNTGCLLKKECRSRRRDESKLASSSQCLGKRSYGQVYQSIGERQRRHSGDLTAAPSTNMLRRPSASFELLTSIAW